MKITVLEPSGFCAGVQRAIDLAIQTKQENRDKEVVVLGMLVHNNDALKILEKHGIRTVFKENSSLEEMSKLIKSPSIVILTAHGHNKNIENILLSNGHKIVDATCPFVNSSFEIISKNVNNGKEIFYVGVKNHPESNAALSISEKVHLIDAKDIKIPEIACENPLVISQTTLSTSQTNKCIEAILEKYSKAEIFDSICKTSTARQEALKNLDSTVDAVLIVGDFKSNNTKTLFEIAKKLYEDKLVKFIENEQDIKEKDLKGLNHIAISSGASTPREIVNNIVEKLMN